MKRKIIRQGHNTLTITLPTNWAKKLNLKPGDEIDVSEKDFCLIVNSTKIQSKKKTVIDINNFTIPLLWRYFQSAYRSGCDEIKVLYEGSSKEYEDAYHYYTTHFDYAKLGWKIPKKNALVMIQSVVDRFLGMAVIESGKNYCIIKEMGEPTTNEFDNSLRRIFLIIFQMYDHILKAADKESGGDIDLCKEIHTMDLSIDRFVDYCCRIMNKMKTYFPDEKRSLLFSSLFLLELLGDEFKYITKHMALKNSNQNGIQEMLKTVKSHFEIYYKMFYKFDRSLVINFGKSDDEIFKKHNKLNVEMDENTKEIENHIITMSKIILSLAELRIEMEMCESKDALMA